MTHDHDLVLRPTAAQTSAALNPPPGRNGGDLVVETLAGLGATTVFGLPGQRFHDQVSAVAARRGIQCRLRLGGRRAQFEVVVVGHLPSFSLRAAAICRDMIVVSSYAVWDAATDVISA